MEAAPLKEPCFNNWTVAGALWVELYSFVFPRDAGSTL